MGEQHCPGHLHRERLIDEALHVILATVDLHVVLQRTAVVMRKFFGLTRLTIHRWVPEHPDLVEVLLVDDPSTRMASEVGARVPLDQSASGPAIRERRRHVLERLDASSPRCLEERALALDGYGALVSIPLIFEDQVLGTLDIAHQPGHGLQDCCLDSAQRIAGLVAMALHNSLMVEEIRRLNRLLDRENAVLKDQIRQVRSESRYIAESPLMRQVLDHARRVAASNATVLIRGETGTGKEGLARLSHEYSPRFGGPFVTVNVGAIPETLIESELFGHEKGAFTGATGRRPGRFEQADGGTLFLDEIGDAPLPVQVKLLRALQDHEIQRVGGAAPVKVDVRVVAATNRPLEALVAGGTFRSDLYYRLNTFPILLPPLRERPEDVRPLVAHFLARHAASMSRKPPRVPEEAWRVLETAEWPGNIRELENFIERALILHPGPDLALPDAAGAVPGARPFAASMEGQGATGGSAGTSGWVPGRWDDEMRDLLGRAMAASGGRIYGASGAAARLGLKPTTLQGKLKRYRLERSVAAPPVPRPGT